MSYEAVTWQHFRAEQPEFANAVAHRLLATKHHVLATLRRDGSPRVSGTEVQFRGDEMCAGMMPNSAKARDLWRDARWSLHSNPGPPTMAGGDSKLSGTAFELTDDETLASYRWHEALEGDFHVFAFRLTQVTHTSLHPAGDRIVIETWHPGCAIARTERA